MLSTGLVQGDDKAKREALEPSDWVSDLYKKRPETLSRDLILPGTHDSGSYKITADRLSGSRGLCGLSEKLFKLPSKWLHRWLNDDLHPNIISVDFYDKTDIVEATIAANQRLLDS